MLLKLASMDEHLHNTDVLIEYRDHCVGDAVYQVDIYQFGPSPQHLPLEDVKKMGLRIAKSVIASLVSVAKIGINDAFNDKKLRSLEGEYKKEKVIELRCSRDVRLLAIRARIRERDALVLIMAERTKGGEQVRRMSEIANAALKRARRAKRIIESYEGLIV